MALLYITRKEHFNAAHRLYNESWSAEKNFEVFGKCANPHWHGHNFTLYVTVKGEPDPDTGWIMNLKELGSLIRQEVTDKIDHKNLNLDVDFMQGLLPSIENLVMKIWERLAPHINGRAQLHSLKLYETENNYVEYFGE
jgi:6-pyruvoyltetrahydropterin/6-carboxytetrahydropterin synthase